MSSLVTLDQYLSSATISSLIYGAPGVGKSVLAASSRQMRTFVFDVDKGMMSVRACLPPEIQKNVSVWRVDSMKDFDLGIEYLYQHQKQFHLAVIDTWTELQRIGLAELGKHRAPQTQDWGNILLKFESTARVLRSLNIHSICLCHETVAKNNSTGQNWFIPNFQGQFAEQYAKHFSLVARMWLHPAQIPDAAGNITTQYQRVLQCNRSDVVEAKDRSWALQMMEVNPNIDSIFSRMVHAVVNGGVNIYADESQVTTV